MVLRTDSGSLKKVVGLKVYEAIRYNDNLAVVFARLLLYTDPRPLPSVESEYIESWEYYLRNWRPGKPHHETWAVNRQKAVRYHDLWS